VRPRKLLAKVLDGNTANISFTDFLRLVEALGFELDHVESSHYIYWHFGISERLSLQPRRSDAKDYQVRQLMGLIETYGLQLNRDED
jgi:hypothetical protein